MTDDTDLDATPLEALIDRFEECGDLSSDEAATARKSLGLPPQDEDTVDIRALIAEMTLPEKIKMAMLGGSVARGLLIFDSNKMIQAFVLKNPRLTQPEVEGFLKSSSISDNVLRLIANSKDWMKHYSHKYHLVANPKTPGDVAIRWIRYLNMTDIKRLAKSKNVSNLVATSAQRMVVAAEQKK